MRTNLTICLIAVLTGLFLQGCTENALQPELKTQKQCCQDVAGLWVQDKGKWEFAINADGQIEWANVALADIKMFPGKTAKIPARGGGFGTFEPGQWSSNYDPKTQQLNVEIIIKDFRQDMGPNYMTGKTTDSFTGFVSDDGTKWEADWYVMETYLIHVPGKDKPQILTDTTEPKLRGTVKFTKIERTK